MSKRTDELRLDMQMSEAVDTCQEALPKSGWKITDQSDNQIKAKSGVGLTKMPSKVEIDLSEAGKGTNLVLNSRISGVGPIQKKHLNEQMDALLGEIESRAG